MELVGVQRTLNPVLKAKALDNRLPSPILGDSYAEQVMRRLDPDFDKGRFGTSQLGLAAVVGATVDWYDLDYAPVIELRQQFLPPREHCSLICSSVTDLTWLEAIPRGRPVLVIAEGLVPYLTEADARPLAQVQRPVPLRLRRPGGAGRLAPAAAARLHTVQPDRAVPVLTRRP